MKSSLESLHATKLKKKNPTHQCTREECSLDKTKEKSRQKCPYETDRDDVFCEFKVFEKCDGWGYELVSGACEDARVQSDQSNSHGKGPEVDNIPVRQEIAPQMIIHAGRYKEGLPIQLRNIFLQIGA